MAAAAAAAAAAAEEQGQGMGAPPPAPLEEPPRLPGSDDDDDGDLPPALCCPITLALLRDPVLLVNDTHTYERSALKTWFEGQRERGEALRSPTTGSVIKSKPQWVTNQTVKALVLEWKEQRGRKG